MSLGFIGREECIMRIGFGKRAVGLALVCALAASAVTPGIAEAKSPVSSISKEGEWEVLKIVNQERMRVGLAPLSMTEELQDAAHVRVEEICRKFSHTRPDGSDCFTVLGEVGATWYDAMAENIAAGYVSPQTVMAGWMRSPGHCANILGANYTHVGVGYCYNGAAEYNYYWTQVFGGTCRPQSISVKKGNVPVSCKRGATIEDLDRVLVVKCEHGEGYLPLTSQMCSRYRKNAVGLQKVKVNFQGKKTTFLVNVGSSSIRKAKVSNIKKKVYNGRAQKQNPKVVLNGKRLVKGRDYVLSYKNNRKVGTATVVITGKGKYTGTIKRTFRIVRKR